MPVELGPRRVAVDVHRNVSRPELPLRKRRSEKRIDLLDFLRAVGMPGWRDEGDIGRSQPDLRSDPGVCRIQGRCVLGNLLLCVSPAPPRPHDASNTSAVPSGTRNGGLTLCGLFTVNLPWDAVPVGYTAKTLRPERLLKVHSHGSVFGKGAEDAFGESRVAHA